VPGLNSKPATTSLLQKQVKDSTHYGEKEKKILKPAPFGLRNNDCRHHKLIDLLIDENGFKPLDLLKDDPGFIDLMFLTYFRLQLARRIQKMEPRFESDIN